MKQRLFIAVPIPENIKKELINITKLPDNFRLTQPQNLHITILFLGETDENNIPQIISELENSIKSHHSFDLEISKFDQFPTSGYPKIIFFTGENEKQKLFQLANDIRDKLKKIGFKDDKSFKYHITIARQKFKANDTIILPKINNSIIIKIDKVILYKSDLKSNGPIYTSLWTGKLID